MWIRGKGKNERILKELQCRPTGESAEKKNQRAVLPHAERAQETKEGGEKQQQSPINHFRFCRTSMEKKKRKKMSPGEKGKGMLAQPLQVLGFYLGVERNENGNLYA